MPESSACLHLAPTFAGVLPTKDAKSFAGGTAYQGSPWKMPVFTKPGLTLMARMPLEPYCRCSSAVKRMLHSLERAYCLNLAGREQGNKAQLR
jgi:hypothetical protein